MTEELKEPCYMGRAPCGCVKFVVMDEPRAMKDSAREIAEMLREGFRLERVEADVFRKEPTFLHCSHDKGKPKRKKKRQPDLPVTERKI